MGRLDRRKDEVGGSEAGRAETQSVGLRTLSKILIFATSLYLRKLTMISVVTGHLEGNVRGNSV